MVRHNEVPMAPSSPISADANDHGPGSIELLDAQRAEVGGGHVRRLLPRRTRRTVGPWCFLDHFGPSDPGLVGIGPHPHMGLQTVTWLLDGELLHKDTIGSEQPIRPGQLNLMSAGNGIAHSEEVMPGRSLRGHGTQLWVAQPDATRHGAPAFEHHGELPAVDIAGADAQVLVGSFAGVTSPARSDSSQVGVQLQLHGAATLGLDPTFEYAIAPLDRDITVDGRPLALDRLAYVAPGRSEIALNVSGAPAPTPAGGPVAPQRFAKGPRVLVLGGTPWDVRVSMWWNFVGRDHDELTQGYLDWSRDAERFGTVASDLARIAAPKPPWIAD